MFVRGKGWPMRILVRSRLADPAAMAFALARLAAAHMEPGSGAFVAIPDRQRGTVRSDNTSLFASIPSPFLWFSCFFLPKSVAACVNGFLIG
jgi:hypothetical protein